jgi:hypothetical protein
MAQPGNSQRSLLAENLLSTTMPLALRPSQSPTPPDRPALDPITPIQEIQEPDDLDDDANVPNNLTADPIPDPDHHSEPDQSEPPPEPNLACSLELLARKIGSLSGAPKSKSAIKPRIPDVFNDTDPSKLNTFIFQCSMYMTARSDDFPDTHLQVMYVLSYLKGNLLDWFQMELNEVLAGDKEYPEWFKSYPKFLSELRRLFGPRDPVTTAMNSLEALRYKDSTKATCYTIDFNRHSRHTGWNEQVLARQYYKGLPDQLKDEIARIGKPAGLKPLQDLVATLDQCYWEHQSEISRDKRSIPNTSAQKGPASDNHHKNCSEGRSGPTQAGGSRPGHLHNATNLHNAWNKDQEKPAYGASSSLGNVTGFFGVWVRVKNFVPQKNLYPRLGYSGLVTGFPKTKI